ncbi:MAG: hypothetical protein UW95_C0003G0011 [Parcubacteria group bacterium GW2011_GWC1_45_14]|nr:MAG: hypothetical protein UW95_C0003G0011 [Parcubacteria group bacterium GW2011_GWC1_45_14]
MPNGYGFLEPFCKYVPEAQTAKAFCDMERYFQNKENRLGMRRWRILDPE